jgi:hypothetical protein
MAGRHYRYETGVAILLDPRFETDLYQVGEPPDSVNECLTRSL